MRLTLYKHHGPTRIHIEAQVTDGGDLQVAGHDIGKAPKEWFDHDDYEYIVTVRKPNKERLFLALKAMHFSDDASAEARLREVARQKNIPYDWFKQDKDHLLLAMIAATFGDDASAVSRFRDFAQEKNIPSEWFSWP